MLSEIYTLYKSLERCGIETEKEHPWIKYATKADGFIVGINEAGEVRRIEFHPKEKMAMTWKLMPDNQKSFPVFNLKVPIWQPSQIDEEIHEIIESQSGNKCFEHIKSICAQATFFSPERYTKLLNKRFSDFPTELKKLLQDSQLENSVFLSLLTRVQKMAGNSEVFLHQLSDTALHFCLEGRIESFELIKQLLIGKWHKKKKVYEQGQIPIVLDVDNYGDFESRTFDEAIKNKVSNVLFQKIKKNVSQAKCALSGQVGALEKKKFPEPKLPILGPSYLFSMNKDAPCHYRYGSISAGNYPVNADLTNELLSSLLFITAPERKGQTWCSVPGSNKNESNLLISYIENMPVSDVDFGFLGEPANDKNTEGEFEVTAKIVCDALMGDGTISPDDQLQVFVLKSVDKGRRQVLFNSLFSISNILQGVEVWRKGAKNHPPFSLVVPLKKGEKADAHDPFCPSPCTIMRIFHCQWTRNGLDNSAVQGCRLNDVYDLFLGPPTIHSRKICTRFLRLLLRQTQPLLLGIAGSLNSGVVKGYSIEAKKTTLCTIGFVAILLYKLGFEREEYMKEEAFQIGRILSLADTLHREYGKVVSKNIPSQLLGNAMMKTALDNPYRALARLNQRLLIYKAWADKGGKEAKLAKWAVGEMGKVAQDLEGCDLGFRPNEAAQAKMLLGYLARN